MSIIDLYPNQLPTTTTVRRDDLIILETDPTGTVITKGIATLDFARGWIEIPDTWSYNAPNQIVVPTDATTLYQKGWGIRFKQGGAYKYMYMTTVAAALLTVTGGSDYTVANAAITDIAVCPNPSQAFGFPTYFNCPVTIYGTGGSAGTYAETATIAGKFSITGGRASAMAEKQVTNKGSWTGSVQIVLPVTPAAFYSGIHQYPPCWWAEGGAANAPKATLRMVNTTIASLIDFINGSFLDWTEVTANDWLILDISYWI